MHCSRLSEVWQVEDQGAGPCSLGVPRVPKHMRVKFIFSFSLDQRMAQTGLNLLQDRHQQLVRVRAQGSPNRDSEKVVSVPHEPRWSRSSLRYAPGGRCTRLQHLGRCKGLRSMVRAPTCD